MFSSYGDGELLFAFLDMVEQNISDHDQLWEWRH